MKNDHEVTLKIRELVYTKNKSLVVKTNLEYMLALYSKELAKDKTTDIDVEATAKHYLETVAKLCRAFQEKRKKALGALASRTAILADEEWIGDIEDIVSEFHPIN